MRIEYIIKYFLRKICSIFNKYIIYKKTISCISVLNILDKNNNVNNKYDNEFNSKITICNYCFNYLNKDILIIDARNPKEYNYSHIPGSVNIYFKKINKKIIYPYESTINDFFKDIDLKKHIIIYCGAGLRSSIFARDLKKKGFENVNLLEGGLYNWIHNRYIICNTNNNDYKVIPHKSFTPMIIDKDKYIQ
jgi:rhodanese-related sulfurtransferase